MNDLPVYTIFRFIQTLESEDGVNSKRIHLFLAFLLQKYT